MNLTPTPKNSPERSQQGKKGPKFGRIKNKKDRAVLPKPKLIDFIGKFQKLVLNLTPPPIIVSKGHKIAPKDHKIASKRPKKVQKIGLYFQNQS